jgi:hypothetical protein
VDTVRCPVKQAIYALHESNRAAAGTLCVTLDELGAEDFHYDHEDSTVRLHEKGNEHRTVGLNIIAADAVKEYMEHAGITSGPLFRPLRNSKVHELADATWMSSRCTGCSCRTLSGFRLQRA